MLSPGRRRLLLRLKISGTLESDHLMTRIRLLLNIILHPSTRAILDLTSMLLGGSPIDQYMTEFALVFIFTIAFCKKRARSFAWFMFTCSLILLGLWPIRPRMDLFTSLSPFARSFLKMEAYLFFRLLLLLLHDRSSLLVAKCTTLSTFAVSLAEKSARLF